MIIRVTIKGQEIKLTRKEYLRIFPENKQKNPYNDKMLRSNYSKDYTRNFSLITWNYANTR